MSVGEYNKPKNKMDILGQIHSFLGTLDFHTHIRIKPLLSYVKQNSMKNRKILEIGCGGGINIYEIAKIDEFFKWYIGVDLDRKAILGARNTNRVCKIKNVEFICKEAFSFLSENKKYTEADTIILYDFLEHIYEPDEFIKRLDSILGAKKIKYIVSVPTKIYPKVFGEKFHKRVGHVMDGYNIKMLDELFQSIDCKRTTFNYNTGVLGNIGCFVFYNLLGGITSESGIFIKSILTLPFRVIDFNSPKVSSSLFAVYVKK